MKKRLKINGFIMFCAVISIFVFPGIFFRQKHIQEGLVEHVVDILGLIFVLLGQFLRVSARGYKAENSKRGGALIKGGPYGCVRNPMYLGIMLIGAGIVLIFFQWWVMLVFLGIFALRYAPLIIEEERKLRGIFAGDYTQYCKDVPRILPRTKALFDHDLCECLPLKIKWIGKEIGSISAVLGFIFFIEGWSAFRQKQFIRYLSELGGDVVIAASFVFLIIVICRRTKNEKCKC